MAGHMNAPMFCLLNFLVTNVADTFGFNIETTKQGAILYTDIICEKITFFPHGIQYTIDGCDFEINELMSEHLYWLMLCVKPLAPWVATVIRHLRTLPHQVRKLVDIAKLNIYTSQCGKKPAMSDGESILRRRLMDVSELMYAKDMYTGVETYTYITAATKNWRNIFNYRFNFRGNTPKPKMNLDVVHLLTMEALFSEVHSWIQIGRDDFICRIEGLTVLLICASNLSYQSIIVFVPRNMCALMGVDLPTCECSHIILLKTDYISLKLLGRNYQKIARGRNGLGNLANLAGWQVCSNMTMGRIKLLSKMQTRVITGSEYRELFKEVWYFYLKKLARSC